MIVMPSNNTGVACGFLAGMYPDRIAWLMSPGRFRTPLWFMKYGVDNGAYASWANGTPWDEQLFFSDLDKYHQTGVKPLWVCVPDVVADRDGTLALWQKYAPIIKDRYAFPLAFVVQDGMTPNDVPKGADIIFIGGTTKWKWAHLRKHWTANFPRVHVGRVNSLRMLHMADEANVESVDGTGWFRSPDRTKDLLKYLEESTKGRPQQQFDFLT